MEVVVVLSPFLPVEFHNFHSLDTQFHQCACSTLPFYQLQLRTNSGQQQKRAIYHLMLETGDLITPEKELNTTGAVVQNKAIYSRIDGHFQCP